MVGLKLNFLVLRIAFDGDSDDEYLCLMAWHAQFYSITFDATKRIYMMVSTARPPSLTIFLSNPRFLHTFQKKNNYHNCRFLLLPQSLSFIIFLLLIYMLHTYIIIIYHITRPSPMWQLAAFTSLHIMHAVYMCSCRPSHAWATCLISIGSNMDKFHIHNLEQDFLAQAVSIYVLVLPFMSYVEPYLVKSQ